MLNLKSKVIIGLAALALAFAAGRWMTPEKILVKKEQVIVKITDTDTTTKKNVVVTIKPDGTRTEVDTSVTETKTKENEMEHSKETKLVVNHSGKTNISILGGVHPTHLQDGFVYGISISRTILGPITIGVWATVPTPVIGASVGLQF